MKSYSQINTINKPTSNFLQAGCPSYRPTNSVKVLKGTYEQGCKLGALVVRRQRENSPEAVKVNIKVGRTETDTKTSSRKQGNSSENSHCNITGHRHCEKKA